MTKTKGGESLNNQNLLQISFVFLTIDNFLDIFQER